jgi:hypothetical protein
VHQTRTVHVSVERIRRYSSPMVAVAGYLVAAAAAIAVALIAAGRRYAITREESIDLGVLGSRHVAILGGLAGFAVTGLVLLVTLGRNLPDASGTQFTTLLTMFLVAYMGYFATSLMFANVSDPGPKPEFNVAAAAYAGAAVTLYFTVLVGWLALRPLFQTFGLTRAADLASWLLVAATIGGYGLVAQHLHRSGYATGRLALLIPLLGAAATLLFGALVAVFGLQSPDSTLDLTIAAFIMGALAFAALGALPVLARQERTARALAAYGRFLILGYTQGVVVLVGFLLLSVLGLG